MMDWVSKKSLLWLLFVLACAMLLPAIVANQEGLAMLGEVPLWALLVLICGASCIWMLRAAATFLIVQPFLGFRLRFEKLLMLELVINFFFISTPMGVGGVYAAITLAGPYGIKPYRIFAVFAISKFLDAFFITFFLILTLMVVRSVLSDLPGGWVLVTALSLGICVLFLGWLLLAIFLFCPRPGLTALSGIFRALGIRRRIFKKLAFFLLRTNRAIRMFGTISWKRKIMVVFASACHWFLAASGLWFSIFIIGGNIAWDQAVAVQVAAAIVGKMASLPGGALGADLAALGLLVPATGAAVSGASILLWRSITFYLPLFLGAVSFFVLTRIRPSEEEAAGGRWRKPGI